MNAVILKAAMFIDFQQQVNKQKKKDLKVPLCLCTAEKNNVSLIKSFTVG